MPPEYSPAAGSGGQATRPEDRARRGVALVFVVAGLAFASLASRTPSIQASLELRPSGLGLLLICLSVGSLTALPLSGPVVHRYGAARTVMAAGCVVASGLLVVGSGVGLAIIPLTAPGLFLTGLGVSTWDVAMNVEATDVERAVGRTLMPRFHAGFSMGTVVGALVGAGFAGLGLSLTSQLVATSLLVVTLVIVGTQQFLPPIADDPGEQGAAPARIFWMWREPRTLTIGLVVLAFAFTEGSANDWMAVALVSGHGTTDAVGALGFGVFLAAMTLARFLGGTVLDRYGRVVVLRCSAGVAIVGLLVVGLAGPTWLVFPGALLWGVGAALGFPTGMSAAGDDPQRAAMRVSVVSSIGYTAFLAGPPLIGFLADHVGILRALLVVLVALVLALATSHSTRTTSVPSPRS